MRSLFSNGNLAFRFNRRSVKTAHPGGPLLETLENRQLMSATLTNGTLLVSGTAAGDSFQLSSTPSVVSVVQKTSGVTTIKSFETAKVQSIVVYGWGGKDYITMGDLSKPVTAFGGDGDDFIEGGTANDKIFGGKGRDVLIGGPGSDQLFGGRGRDKIFGGSPKAKGKNIDGDKNKCFGGKGKDKLGKDCNVKD